jgi:hypothetical protein
LFQALNLWGYDILFFITSSRMRPSRSKSINEARSVQTCSYNILKYFILVYTNIYIIFILRQYQKTKNKKIMTNLLGHLVLELLPFQIYSVKYPSVDSTIYFTYHLNIKKLYLTDRRSLILEERR